MELEIIVMGLLKLRYEVDEIEELKRINEQAFGDAVK